MKKMTALLLGTIATLLVAAPMNGTKFMLKQPDGSRVPVLVYGDEFYATYETPSGYTVMRNSEGWICYAELNSDSSDYRTTSQIYNGTEVRQSGDKHIRISSKSTQHKVTDGLNRLSDPRAPKRSTPAPQTLTKIIKEQKK